MSQRPIQLGPDPHRSYLERWNELHPGRYGRADTYDDSDGAWLQQNGEGDGSTSPTTGGLLETFLGLVILTVAPLAGGIATVLLYRWTVPDHLTSGWVLGYVATFLVSTVTAALLVYAVRRLLLAAAFLALTLGIGYFSWNLVAG